MRVIHGSRMTPHRHDMHELSVCLRDSGECIIGGEHYLNRRGQIYFIFGGTLHYAHNTPEDPAEFVFFCFPTDHFANRGQLHIQEHAARLEARQCFCAPPAKYSGSSGDDAVSLALALISELDTPHLFSEDYAEAMLAQLVVLFFRQSGSEYPEKNSQEKECIQILCHRLRKNPLEDLSLGEAAREACMSRTKFATQFKGFTGMTYREYVNNYRLEHACKKLGGQDCSITEAALSSGFLSLSYFHRCFRERYGMTPHAVKKLLLQTRFPHILREERFVDEQSKEV